jgi:hypothetical protein
MNVNQTTGLPIGGYVSLGVWTEMTIIRADVDLNVQLDTLLATFSDYDRLTNGTTYKNNVTSIYHVVSPATKCVRLVLLAVAVLNAF